MKTAKKATPAKTKRAVMIGGLAATVLGRYRVSGTGVFTARQMMAAFPAFSASELVHAVGELLEKGLVTQTGHEDKATYSLTELGRTGQVGVA